MVYIYTGPKWLGNMLIETNEANKVFSVRFCNTQNLPKISSSHDIHAIIKQFDEYFQGTRMKFSFPYTLQGTPFQKKVWEALRDILHPLSYSRLAQHIGKPRAIRAVASAVASNPLILVIPCHRVVRKDNRIGTYAIKTLEYKRGKTIKKKLLQHEEHSIQRKAA